jgi:heptosyltransferase-3
MTSTRMPKVGSPGRVLVVTLRYLGDALLSTALVHALKRHWPTCTIDVLTFSGTEGAFEGNPDIARVTAVPERASAIETLRHTLSIWRRYDLAVVAQTGTRPFLFGWAAGRQRVALVSAIAGKSWWKRSLLDGYAVFDDRGARVLENQRIARLLGIDDAPVVVPPSAGWSRDEVSAALGFDPAMTPFAIVHPSPRWRYKQWTREGWHSIVRDLGSRGLRVVITGGPAPEERAYVDALLEGLDGALYERVDGLWTLAQTADVLRHAVLYVGPDTATTHLAAACGTPTAAIFGPTDPSIWGPWPAHEGAAYARVAMHQHRGNVVLLQNPELTCVPCQLEGCERRRDSYSQCLDRLPAERVIAAAESLLK